MLKPIRIDADALKPFHDILPGEEPALSPCPDGPRQGGLYPVSDVRLVGNERAYVNECLDSNWISSRGAFIARFERAFAAEAGCAHGIACANGTAALHLVMAALGIGPGDEVIVPAFTMIAPANAARYLGATVKLVDVEPAHFGLDPALVEAAITPRTKAIVLVHIYGHPAAATDAVAAIARKHGLPLIEDAAEAHGAEIGGRRVGGIGLAGTFSFYANKVVSCGEGGMITTNDAALAEVARRLRDHAFSPERHFWHEYLGFNYRMTSLQAALGLAQTEQLQNFVATRRRLRLLYDSHLRRLPGFALPTEAPGMHSVFWMYAIRVGPAFGMTRNRLRTSLGRRGIDTRSFFVPVHLQPVYFEQFRGRRFPVSEALCGDGLYLPTSDNLNEDDVAWICAQIADLRLESQGSLVHMES
jgi:perosamine synthetase